MYMLINGTLSKSFLSPQIPVFIDPSKVHTPLSIPWMTLQYHYKRLSNRNAGSEDSVAWKTSASGKTCDGWLLLDKIMLALNPLVWMLNKLKIISEVAWNIFDGLRFTACFWLRTFHQKPALCPSCFGGLFCGIFSLDSWDKFVFYMCQYILYVCLTSWNITLAFTGGESAYLKQNI